MESSILWRSVPLQEAGSQEPEIESAEALEDGLDHTSRSHVVTLLMRSGADIFSQSLNWLDWLAPLYSRFGASLLTSLFP